MVVLPTTVGLCVRQGIKKQMFNNNKKMIREIKDEDLTVSPACTKPLVVGSTVILGDCVAGMKEYPDKYFDLAVVDPPYGIGEDGGKFRDRKGGGHRILAKKNWDNEKPLYEYWIELFRVSKDQIVWGGNYFTKYLPESRGWIYWDKLMGGDFSDGELAWTSFDKVLKKVTMCNKMGGKIHPTEKPIRIYDFCFDFAKIEVGAKVLDTHLGSGSSRISADKNGFDFTGFEIDKDYFEAGEKRYQNYKSQLRIEGW